ncbi:unnamed protein product [Cladocopium goreaui]|uniref:Far upstream element-binding protein 1 n=1 Tax=Cladocopium goreaui TaxID=2562237 RepID=A0A9P1BKY1_9DINO|nr:unnamed protein product [Cladocopium goreaui]
MAAWLQVVCVDPVSPLSCHPSVSLVFNTSDFPLNDESCLLSGERLQFVAPWRELDPSVLSKNGLHSVHSVQFTTPVSREVAHTPKANRHFKSVVCGTAAMLLTWLGSQRRKPARCQPIESTLRAAQDKGAASNTPPPPPPPGPPPVPQAKAKSSSNPSPATKPPPPPPPDVEAEKDVPNSDSPAPASKASKAAAEASKTSVVETTASTPVQKAEKDVPKSDSPAPASKASKTAAEASKTTVVETTASTPVQKAEKDVPKSDSPAPASKASKAAAEASKRSVVETTASTPVQKAEKDVPKSDSPAPASKASKAAAEASKTTVVETTASTPVQKAEKDVPKSDSPAPASNVSKALEAHIAFLEKELNQSNSSNEILKRQVEELESYKERNEQATKAAAENEKKQFRRPGGPDQKSLADAQKVAQLIGTAKLEEDSAQIKKLKESLEKAQDNCAAKESELSLLQADKEKDSAQIQELKESLRAAQEKCAAKESDVFQMQLEKEQALTRAKSLEESLKKVQDDSEDTRQLKEVLKKTEEITAPFVDDGEDPSLLREKAEGSQRRAAALERDNQELQAQLAQTSKELAELSEVQETLIAAEKRAESLSSGLRQISEQIGATGGGFLALFQQPSEDELIRDIQAEIQKLKS